MRRTRGAFGQSRLNAPLNSLPSVALSLHSAPAMTSAAPDRAPGTVDSALPVLALLGGSVLWGLSWLPLKYFARFGIEGVIVTLVAHGSVGAIALSMTTLLPSASACS